MMPSPENKMFGPGFQTSPTPLSYADKVIQICVEDAIREADRETDTRPKVKKEPGDPSYQQWSPGTPELDDLIERISQVVVRNANMCAAVASNLSKGPHTEELVRDAIRNSQSKTGLSDLSAMTSRDLELSKIRKIKEISVQYARDIRSVYEPAVKPPEKSPTNISTPFGSATTASVPRSGSGAEEEQQRRTPKTRKTLPEQVPDDDSDSGISSGDTFEALNMAALKQRGKGNYSCPKGKRCTRGGLDKNGNVIVFDRNSAFVQHCNKHRKPFKCDLAGCPNPIKKRRFARRDGLDRHKKTVKHTEMTT